MNFLPIFCFFTLFLIVASQENQDAEGVSVEKPGQRSAESLPPKSPSKRSLYYGGYGYGGLGYGGLGYGGLGYGGLGYGGYGGYGGYYPYYGGYGWGGYGWGYPYGHYGYW